MNMPNAITNTEFGERVGCHHSMASRILAGKRLPSIELMERISDEFNVSMDAMLKARKKGPDELGKLLRRRIIAPANVAARKAPKSAKKARKAA